jgi:hypothetical protein
MEFLVGSGDEYQEYQYSKIEVADRQGFDNSDINLNAIGMR